MAGFAGFVQLGNTIDVAIVSRNSSLVPVDADALPTYRIYSPAGFMNSGSLAFKDTAAITGATSANPTVFTSVGHNYTVGQLITTSGITVVSGSNGFNLTAQITATTTNTFTVAVDNSGSGVFLSGGTGAHAVGIYDFNFTPTIGANYASGTIYSVIVYGLFSTVSKVIDFFTFQVT